MNRIGEFDIPQRPRFHGGPTEVGVHVLSQHVFCPRAAILAMETGQDSGEEGQPLGPRLDGCFDYDELRFAEAIRGAWNDVRSWGLLLAPAAMLILGLWRLWSPMAGLIGTLPCFYCLARLWEAAMRLIDLIRERAIFNATPPLNVDLTSTQIQEVNWWSLRKAGFDCLKPADAFRDPESGLVGKPWRMLVKGTTLRIPVIRKHRGEHVWRPQHRVRISAYCRLIETCQGGQAPFGILLFADSYDCLIIPNTVIEQSQFEEALQNAREFLHIYHQGQAAPMRPFDNRCLGCHFGQPRPFVAGETQTIINGTPIVPLRTEAADRKMYHCPCGDRFNWVPPHEEALELRISDRR
jgi:hypothetical protein